MTKTQHVRKICEYSFMRVVFCKQIGSISSTRRNWRDCRFTLNNATLIIMLIFFRHGSLQYLFEEMVYRDMFFLHCSKPHSYRFSPKWLLMCLFNFCSLFPHQFSPYLYNVEIMVREKVFLCRFQFYVNSANSGLRVRDRLQAVLCFHRFTCCLKLFQGLIVSA